MLAISRKDGQTIVVGDSVIGIHQSKRGRVRIWIQAPPGTPIIRGELVELPRMASAGGMAPELVEAT
jgi:sRNA-binding carbon storage regulator CsrA